MKFLALSLFLFSTSLFARVTLDISIVQKRGIDKGLILTKEIYVRENILRAKKTRVIPSNDIALDLRVAYSKKIESDEFGPPSKVEIKGTLFMGGEESEFNILTELGQNASLVQKDSKDQIIELTFKPHVL